MNPRSLLVALLLLPLAVTAKDAPAFDPAAAPAGLAADFLDGDKLDRLAGTKRIAITNFRVEFAVENSASAQSSSSAGWTASKSQIRLTGISDENRQAITDQLYDNLVQQLTSAGFEVLPMATVQADAEYQSLQPVLKTSTEPVGTQIGKSVFVGPRGMATYRSNEDRHLGVGSLLGGISTTQPQNIEPRIAKSLDATVLRATVAVHFVNQSAKGGMFRMGSSVTTEESLALVPELTQFLFITPGDGKARISLKHPVTMPGDILTLADVTKGKDKAAEAIGNVLTGLMAGGGRSTKKLEATAAPEAYMGAVTRYGQALEAATVSLLGPASSRRSPRRLPPRPQATSPSARSAACTADRAATRCWKASSFGNAARSSFTTRAQLVTVKR
jgi:hypothetical protein